MSHQSQTAVLRAMRGVVFTGPGDATAGAPALAAPSEHGDNDPAARRRLPLVAARRLRKLADWLSATATGAQAAELAERINVVFRSAKERPFAERKATLRRNKPGITPIGSWHP